ncbi:MAG: FkbM family methyltransferase [Rhodocyclaceae bacterium]|nr:FkbM family methyltransferase [Rhodocyclaceae bacterium]
MYKTWFDTGRNDHLGVGEFFEYIIKALYTSVLKEGNMAIDGGANQGRHTFPMAKLVGNGGLVLGFEALPDYAARLRTALAAANVSNATIVNKAIGSRIGTTEFTFVPDCAGMSGIKERQGIPETAKKNITQIQVQLTTMDAELNEFPPDRIVRFVKLDLEGGEYDALRGAEFIMRYHQPLIVFEHAFDWSTKLYGYDKESWYDLFSRTGYSLFDLFGRPFAQANWGRRDTPWYMVAAKRIDDVEFVQRTLPALIEVIYEPCAKYIKHFKQPT